MFGRSDHSPLPGQGGFVFCGSSEDTQRLLQLLQQRNPSLREFEYDDEGIFTPNGGLAKQLTRTGPFIVCDKRNATPMKAMQRASIQSEAEIFQFLMSPPAASEKVYTAKFSRQSISKVQAEKKLLNNRRGTSQEEAMRKSDLDSGRVRAIEVADAYGFTNPRPRSWNWTHLIAHRFIGEGGQNGKNLVLATAECNTQMMFVEDKVSQLVNKLPHDNDYVEIIATAQLHNKSQLATKITYQIKAPALNFDLTLCFYGTMRYKPQNHLADFYGAIFDYCLEKGEPQCFAETPFDQANKRVSKRPKIVDENQDSHNLWEDDLDAPRRLSFSEI